MVSIVVEAEQQAEIWRPADRQYPLATILRPGRNISVRNSSREIVCEIVTWIVAGMGLGLAIWIVFLIALKLGN